MKSNKATLVAATLALVLIHLLASPLRAEDLIEKEGVAVGVTAGNVAAIPAKFASVTVGLLAGAMSFILTGGNIDLTKQIWRDTTEPPYLITPEVAKKAVGQRPQLLEKETKQAATPMENQ